MAYTPIDWQDGEQGGTPVSAANLNHMDEGIESAHDAVEAAQGDLNDATSSATANELVRRDANARAQFGSPSASADAATKEYVDNTVGAIGSERFQYSGGWDVNGQVEAGADQAHGVIDVTIPPGKSLVLKRARFDAGLSASFRLVVNVSGTGTSAWTSSAESGEEEPNHTLITNSDGSPIQRSLSVRSLNTHGSTQFVLRVVGWWLDLSIE